jgi:glycosyltransferase involved in cell wall biosynthesis
MTQAAQMTNFEQLKELVRPYYLRWLYFPLVPGSRPEQFTQCWRYPWWPLDRVPRLSNQSGLDDFIFYPMNDWHVRVQRSHHLAREFAALGRRCIYLNPHLGRQFPETRSRDRSHRVAKLEDNIFELHVRLAAEPVFHHRLLSGSESRVVAGAVKDLCKAIDSGRAVQIVSLPVWLEAAAALRESSGFPIVYDCHDLLSGFPAISRDVLDREAELFRVANLVLFSSADLRDRFTKTDPGLMEKSVIVRNAVRMEQFESTGQQPRKTSRVAGYIGAIDAWFDVESLETAARANPEIQFVLIGRVENESARGLGKLGNVQLRGEVSYADLRAELSNFDIALIPFRVNDLTQATNPIKLYEYFSCGLPVVSAPLPEVALFGDLVYLASTGDEFASAVRRAAEENDPALAERRREVARRESWSKRASTILDELERLRLVHPSS